MTKKIIFLSQSRIKFESIQSNTKFFDLIEHSSTNEERFSKVSGTTTNNIRVKRFQKLNSTKNQKHEGNRLWNNLLFHLLINNILGKIIASSFKRTFYDPLVYLQYYKVNQKSKKKVFKQGEIKGKTFFNYLLYKI